MYTLMSFSFGVLPRLARVLWPSSTSTSVMWSAVSCFRAVFPLPSLILVFQQQRDAVSQLPPSFCHSCKLLHRLAASPSIAAGTADQHYCRQCTPALKTSIAAGRANQHCCRCGRPALLQALPTGAMRRKLCTSAAVRLLPHAITSDHNQWQLPAAAFHSSERFSSGDECPLPHRVLAVSSLC